MIGLVLAIGLQWGAPLPHRPPGEGTLWQLEVCRHRVGSEYSDCLPYGEPGSDEEFVAVCVAGVAEAKRDFPGENYPCMRVNRRDIERALAPRLE